MIKSINSEELMEAHKAGENFVLIDCREQGEWDEGHIEFAQFVPLSELDKVYEEKIPADKNTRLILQCRSGKRSMNACNFLQEAGYQDLTNLEGGILGWQDEGFDVVK